MKCYEVRQLFMFVIKKTKKQKQTNIALELLFRIFFNKTLKMPFHISLYINTCWKKHLLL